MRFTTLVATLAAAALIGATSALAAMHPTLGARLSGMGEHGIVNIQSHEAKGQLCWTFELTTKGVTGATIRDAHGMIVAHLGMHYVAKGCAAAPKKALRLIETTPGYGTFVVSQ